VLAVLEMIQTDKLVLKVEIQYLAQLLLQEVVEAVLVHLALTVEMVDQVVVADLLLAF
jgi:hypothetical protein